MRKVFFILLLVCSGLLYGLTGSGETEYFTLDVVPPEVELISPNGGEEWYIGDTNPIQWTATDTNLAADGVYLWYSLNGGSEYHGLASALSNSGSFAWELPDVQSYNARVRIRVSDNFGNSTFRNSAGAFSITYVPPAAPDSVSIDTSNSVDAVLSWTPVVTTIYGSPIIPDGYIVLYNETPYTDEQFYYYHGETTNTCYTHYNVARRRDQMFYRIVAFKDYDGRLASILSCNRRDEANPRLWSDILDELKTEGGAK